MALTWRIANNATVIKNFAHNLEYSMYKTYGLKHKCSVKKIIAKFSRNGIFGVAYETKSGRKFSELYNYGIKRVKRLIPYIHLSADGKGVEYFHSGARAASGVLAFDFSKEALYLKLITCSCPILFSG